MHNLYAELTISCRHTHSTHPLLSPYTCTTVPPSFVATHKHCDNDRHTQTVWNIVITIAYPHKNRRPTNWSVNSSRELRTSLIHFCETYWSSMNLNEFRPSTYRPKYQQIHTPTSIYKYYEYRLPKLEYITIRHTHEILYAWHMLYEWNIIRMKYYTHETKQPE